jgi:DNA-binding transcriptional LysR family regulator
MNLFVITRWSLFPRNGGGGMLSERGCNRRLFLKSGQFSSILGMVCAGLGVSIIPAMALEKRNGCQFVPLADGRATRAIGAVTSKGRSLSRVQQAFLTHLTAKIASTPAHLAR